VDHPEVQEPNREPIHSARTGGMIEKMRTCSFDFTVLHLADKIGYTRHYDAGGYEDDENEEDMENDDEFGSDAERGKSQALCLGIHVADYDICLFSNRGSRAKARAIHG
jgi:hypothetical protein